MRAIDINNSIEHNCPIRLTTIDFSESSPHFLVLAYPAGRQQRANSFIPYFIASKSDLPLLKQCPFSGAQTYDCLPISCCSPKLRQQFSTTMFIKDLWQDNAVKREVSDYLFRESAATCDARYFGYDADVGMVSSSLLAASLLAEISEPRAPLRLMPLDVQWQRLMAAFRLPMSLMEKISLFVEWVGGDHYDLHRNGYGRKGLLDKALFPLLAQKLLTDFVHEWRDPAKVWYIGFRLLVGLPAEALRCSLSAALTLLTLPALIVAHYCRPSLYPHDNSKSLNNKLKDVKRLVKLASNEKAVAPKDGATTLQNWSATFLNSYAVGRRYCVIDRKGITPSGWVNSPLVDTEQGNVRMTQQCSASSGR